MLDITSVLSVVSELMLRILFSTAVLVLFSETLLTAAHPLVPAKSLKSIEHVWEGAARAAAVVWTPLDLQLHVAAEPLLKLDTFDVLYTCGLLCSILQCALTGGDARDREAAVSRQSDSERRPVGFPEGWCLLRSFFNRRCIKCCLRLHAFTACLCCRSFCKGSR